MERTLSLNPVAKKYDEAFRRQAVETVLRGGKTVKQAAEDLGMSQLLDLPVEEEVFPAGCRAGIDGKNIRFSRAG
jgi:hypothetical protein